MVGGFDRVEHEMFTSNFDLLAAAVGKTLLFSVVGYYLIKKGNTLFKIVSRQEPPGSSETPKS